MFYAVKDYLGSNWIFLIGIMLLVACEQDDQGTVPTEPNPIFGAWKLTEVLPDGEENWTSIEDGYEAIFSPDFTYQDTDTARCSSGVPNVGTYSFGTVYSTPIVEVFLDCNRKLAPPTFIYLEISVHEEILHAIPFDGMPIYDLYRFERLSY